MIATIILTLIFFGVITLIGFVVVGLIVDKLYAWCLSTTALKFTVVGIIVAFSVMVILLIEYLLLPLWGVSL